MKGRITCKQVNTAVDELNKTVDAKYVLLRTSKSHLTDAVRRAIRQYKDQERKETQGAYLWLLLYMFLNKCHAVAGTTARCALHNECTNY